MRGDPPPRPGEYQMCLACCAGGYAWQPLENMTTEAMADQLRELRADETAGPSTKQWTLVGIAIAAAMLATAALFLGAFGLLQVRAWPPALIGLIMYRTTLYLAWDANGTAPLALTQLALLYNSVWLREPGVAAMRDLLPATVLQLVLTLLLWAQRGLGWMPDYLAAPISGPSFGEWFFIRRLTLCLVPLLISAGMLVHVPSEYLTPAVVAAIFAHWALGGLVYYMFRTQRRLAEFTAGNDLTNTPRVLLFRMVALGGLLETGLLVALGWAIANPRSDNPRILWAGPIVATAVLLILFFAHFVQLVICRCAGPSGIEIRRWCGCYLPPFGDSARPARMATRT